MIADQAEYGRPGNTLKCNGQVSRLIYFSSSSARPTRIATGIMRAGGMLRFGSSQYIAEVEALYKLLSMFERQRLKGGVR